MTKRLSIEKTFDLRNATIVYGADKIARYTDKPGSVSDLAHVKAVLAIYRELGAGEKVLVLADVTHLKKADAESRAFGAGPEFAAAVQAMGAVVGSPVSAMIGNFFLRVSKPLYPVRLFTTAEAAERWLKTLQPQ